MNLDILNKVLFTIDFTFDKIVFINLASLIIIGVIFSLVYNLTRR